MKYLLYTIILFFIALIHISLLSNYHFLSSFLNLFYVILFSYYIARKSTLSLYLFFIGGIFLDLLLLTRVGITSTSFFISLLIYTALTRVFPAEVIGSYFSTVISCIVFYIFNAIAIKFIEVADIRLYLLAIPFALLNALLICVFAAIIDMIKTKKTVNKIRID